MSKYQKWILSPLLDRINIYIEVPRMDYEKPSGNKVVESLEAIRQRVQTICWKLKAQCKKVIPDLNLNFRHILQKPEYEKADFWKSFFSSLAQKANLSGPDGIWTHEPLDYTFSWRASYPAR